MFDHIKRALLSGKIEQKCSGIYNSIYIHINNDEELKNYTKMHNVIENYTMTLAWYIYYEEVKRKRGNNDAYIIMYTVVHTMLHNDNAAKGFLAALAVYSGELNHKIELAKNNKNFDIDRVITNHYFETIISDNNLFNVHFKDNFKKKNYKKIYEIIKEAREEAERVV